MKDFLQFFIENFVATVAAIVSAIVGILELVKWTKSSPHAKDTTRKLIAVSGAVFAIAFIYLVVQYATIDRDTERDNYTTEIGGCIVIGSELPTGSESGTEIKTEPVPSEMPGTEISGVVIDGDVNDSTIVNGNNNTINNINTENTVQKPVDVPITVSSVTLSKSSFYMMVGETTQLTAKVAYSDNSVNGDVVWISSDETIASIDKNGVITAHAPGEVEIIAQASRENTYKEDRCKVVVKTKLTGYSIALSTDKASLYENFYVYVTPYDADVEIILYAKAPSGHIDVLEYTEEKKYYIDTEVGVWTIYAQIKNEVGVYDATKPEDFVTIEILPLDFGI